MFDYIGKTIKLLAKVFLWISIAASVIWGIVFIVETHSPFGLLIIICGCVAAFIICVFTYGFGELIDTEMDIRRILRKPNSKEKAEAPAENNMTGSETKKAEKDEQKKAKKKAAKKAELSKMLEFGLITEEEYKIMTANSDGTNNE